MTTTILTGDCRDVLECLPDNSFQCCVTSPPYFGLRDYGVDGQIGLEIAPDEYVAKLVDVFGQVRRVLRDDGTLWLNLGDSYASGGRGGGFKPKDLLMIPARVAMALQADGWYLRSDIIWHKTNPMPESVTDRPTCAHEHVFLFAKSTKYYYNANAIRTALTSSSVSRLSQDVESQSGSLRANGGAKTNGPMKAVGGDKQRGHSRRHDGFNDRWDKMSKEEQQANGANARNVWSIAPSPYRGAHFATFPPELAERCIKAGSAEGDNVLDPFGGSGTTAMVANRLGRRSVIIELNPEYAVLANGRVQAGK